MHSLHRNIGKTVIGAVVAAFGLIAYPVQAQEPLIVVEAEDAVSTNFAAGPVLLFGAGNNRTLQLNQQTRIGETTFYAEYAVYVPSSGTYRFWYGGSIPGSREPILPSYGSPLVLQINDDEARELSWEDVRVGPVYSSPYRWVLAAEVQLEEGLNQVRIEVRDRRRYDGHYFLYLDRLVFESSSAAEADGESPTDPAEAVDLPALSTLSVEPESIEDLLVILRDDPDDIDAWVRLADLYTLVGDHINALRYLNRAAVIDSTNPAILQLTARNLSWRGDVPGGLDAYWRLLAAAPNRLESYLEAGKIAAWNGFYGASEQYYLAGLSTFPDNLQLRINLGFTYLWSAQESRANEVFQRAESTVDSVDDVLTVAREYRLNEEPERARRFLARQLENAPGDASISVELYDLLRSLNRDEEASILAGNARAAAADPELLSALLARVDRTYELRQELIAEFEAAAAADPYNPAPRRTLAQTYLWIDRREEGITQYEYLLALEYLNGLRRRWDGARDFVERAALAAVVERDLRATLRELAAASARMDAALSAVGSIDEETTDEEAAAAYDRVGDVAGTITVARGRIESLIDFVSPRTTPPVVAPDADDRDDQLSGDEGTVAADPLSAALASSRESWNAIEENSDWTPALPRTRREIGLAQGSIPGVTTTITLLDWLLSPEQTLPPSGLLVGVAAPIEQLLLTWAWAVAGEAAALDRALEELPGDAAQILLYRELYRIEEASATAAPGSVAEAQTLGQSVRDGLPEVQRAAAVALGSLAGERAAVLEVLQLETRSSLFELQNETVTLRSQLGRFYVEAGDIPRGIAQFEAVQEVDPNNLDTLFSLAAAYQQQGLWARAMTSYAAIYRQDPSYRNVASLHNAIARRNADEFRAGVRSAAEPTRVVLGSDLGYTWQINSRMAIRLGVEANGTRLKTNSEGITRQKYFEQGRLLGAVPLSFLDSRLVIEPTAGIDFNGNELFFTSADGEDPTLFPDFFQNWQLEPVVGFAARYTGGPAFLSLSYSYGPYRPAADLPLETVRAVRPAYFAHTLRAGASTDLAGRPSPFWSRLRTSTGGSIDLISDGEDGAQRWTVQQDVQLALLARTQPFTRLAVGLSATFEDFHDRNGSPAYDEFYRPDEVFQLGAHLGAELFRTVRSDVIIGIIGRAYGGLYQTALFDPGRPDPFELESGLRGAGDLALELTRRDVAFQLGMSVSRVWDGDTDATDYYSAGVSLTTIVRNPSLLVP